MVVHPGGAAEARQTPAVIEMERAGRLLYLIDAFQTGSARARRDHSGKWFLSYNRTDDAARVQDILTALAFAGQQGRDTTRLVGLGNAGVWCLFAAAVAPVPVELRAESNGFAGADEDFRDRFFVPGIQRAGGLAAALKLTALSTSPVPPPYPPISRAAPDTASRHYPSAPGRSATGTAGTPAP